jgi:hypothetical protein
MAPAIESSARISLLDLLLLLGVAVHLRLERSILIRKGSVVPPGVILQGPNISTSAMPVEVGEMDRRCFEKALQFPSWL